MAAEFVCCSLTPQQQKVLLRQPIKKDGLLRINMTLVNDAVSKLDVFRKYIEIQNKSHMTSLQLVKEIWRMVCPNVCI